MPLTKTLKTFAPLLLLAFFVLVIVLFILFRPQPNRDFTPPSPQITVEVLELAPRPVQVNILSYGLVRPRIQSQLVSQVGGKIDFVSESFRDGGFFDKGDTLVSVEKTDYEIAVRAAEANLLDAERQYQEELALAEQAEQDWKRLGNKNKPLPLVLRKPQLAAAEARVKAARANLDGAELDLKRTDIIAPYSGRALNKNVDIGQVISANTVLGEIYATDALEIRLPVKNNELPLMELPESYRHQADTAGSYPEAIIHSNLAKEEAWQANIVRTSGAMDNNSRQLYVVARINDPYGEKAEGKIPLKVNQYVTARIRGKVLDNAIAIPVKTIYQGSYVYLHEDGVVNRRPVELLWQNTEEAVIKSGLAAGDRLVLTPLGQISSGTRVRLKDQPDNEQGLPGWASNIPPERLEQLKAKAKQEGRPLRDVLVEAGKTRGAMQ